MLFEKEDWTDFRSLATLCQKAGVPREKLPALAAKELVDNALDECGQCDINLAKPKGFRVRDEGSGIEGSDERIASLFSVRRSMLSSKRRRLPSRGALGNGLRVVVGAVLSTGGTITVTTFGRTLVLRPEHDDGSTRVLSSTPCGETRGTTIEVRFGPGLTVDGDALAWANQALMLASPDSPAYKGKSSPYWYDSDAFFELMRGAVDQTVRDFIGEFDGCAGSKASQIAGGFIGRPARSLDFAEADELLASARSISEPVNPARLGRVGKKMYLPRRYKYLRDEFTVSPSRGRHGATIPCVIEVWAGEAHAPRARLAVNRTPVVSEIESHHAAKDRTLALFGCGLSHEFKVGPRPVDLLVNIETPYMPITSDGKAPDLTLFRYGLGELIASTCSAFKRQSRSAEKDTQAAVVKARLDEAIEEVSGNGRYRYSERQLFYAIRPHLIAAIGKEPDWNRFKGIITDIERELEHDLPKIYRDVRGTLYIPHVGDDIPLGTLSVEAYERRPWTFNKILYCEKEGFFPLLKDAKWPEHNDCALLTAKGFATRAARDLLDHIGVMDEPIQFFCVHDADAPGTSIQHALENATKARGARVKPVKNLGLDPWEALEMGLPVEKVIEKPGKKARRGVGGYVKERDAELAEGRAEHADERKLLDRYGKESWQGWLQDWRVELNALATPERILAWLDGKFEPYRGKVDPPASVVHRRLEGKLRENIRQREIDRVLEEARIDERVEARFREKADDLAERVAAIDEEIGRDLAEHPEHLWEAAVDRVAEELAE